MLLKGTFIKYIKDIEGQTIKNLKSQSIDDLISYTVAFYETNSKYIYILINTAHSTNFSNKFKNILKSVIFDYYNLSKDNIENEYYVEFALSALIGTFSFWYKNNKNIDIEKLASLVNPLIKNTLSPIIKI